MRPAAAAVCHALDLTFLRGTSLLVPFPVRAEWFREWRAELWHVRHECAHDEFSWAAERQVRDFCLGAWQDAAFLRHERGEVAVASASVHGSARYCLLSLCALLIVCAVVARLLPGIAAEEVGSQLALRQGVVLIQNRPGEPSTAFSVYRDWASRQQRFFDRLAYYRVGREAAGPGQTWRVAHSTEGLFAVLGTPPTGEDQAGVPRALLSEHLWRSRFHSDPDVVGTTVTIGDQQVPVAGIAPAETVRLPGDADVWLLEPEAQMARTGLYQTGYVLAMLSPLGQAMMDGDTIDITTESPDGDSLQMTGVTLRPEGAGPSSIYWFALLLAVLALPAITSTFQSESSFASHQPSFGTRARRWAFMASKLGLIAGLGYCGGLDLAYWNVAQYTPGAESVQFSATFLLCLFGLRWAIVDQSRRCPVCLRRVTHPAQVGIASCNFLGWNGTEMICTGGHVLLHVPSLPTSWFSRQRWMYLDTSWDFLFADGPGH